MDNLVDASVQLERNTTNISLSTYLTPRFVSFWNMQLSRAVPNHHKDSMFLCNSQIKTRNKGN